MAFFAVAVGHLPATLNTIRTKNNCCETVQMFFCHCLTMLFAQLVGWSVAWLVVGGWGCLIGWSFGWWVHALCCISRLWHSSSSHSLDQAPTEVSKQVNGSIAAMAAGHSS